MFMSVFPVSRREDFTGFSRIWPKRRPILENHQHPDRLKMRRPGTQIRKLLSSPASRAIAGSAILICGTCLLESNLWGQRGELELVITDSASGDPLAAMVQIENVNGRAYFPKDALRIGDAFVSGSRTMMQLPQGEYLFAIDRGPEFRTLHGKFIVERGATDTKTVSLKRIRDLKAEGWFSGDIGLFVEPSQAALVMNAADLQFAQIVSWSNRENYWQKHVLGESAIQQLESGRIYDEVAGADWRDGGGLIFGNRSAPINLVDELADYHSPMETLQFIKTSPEPFVCLIDMTHWDLPLWLASQQIDAVSLAGPEIFEAKAGTGSRAATPGARTASDDRWEGVDANFYGEAIYFHLLNAGFRIPPTACSAAGRGTNRPGYNRVYVHCGEEFTHERWLDFQKQGRVFITNGPLLRVRANHQLPGHVFRSDGTYTVEIELTAELAVQEHADTLEIIRNGKIEHAIALDDWARQGGQLPKLEFQQSGWFLVRVVTQKEPSVHFAATGPYYVEVADNRRISKQSAQFFIDWIFERGRILKTAGDEDSTRTFEQYRDALKFWQQILADANTL
jgi:hypothetical protein